MLDNGAVSLYFLFVIAWPMKRGLSWVLPAGKPLCRLPNANHFD